jgi:hypothetical protein
MTTLKIFPLNVHIFFKEFFKLPAIIAPSVHKSIRFSTSCMPGNGLLFARNAAINTAFFSMKIVYSNREK